MKLVLDVLERDAAGYLVKTGTKEFGPTEHPLNKWVVRPKATEIRPPMSGALNVNPKMKKICLDKLAQGAIGFLTAVSNDPYNRDFTFVTSGPRAGGHGWSIVPNNFEQSMLVFAIRWLPKKTWLNNRDPFSVPDVTNPSYKQFLHDAIIWALFHGANCASSLERVGYLGKSYKIDNEFFWVDPSVMAKVSDKPPRIIQQLKTAKRRFVSTWLVQKQSVGAFSPDAATLVKDATNLTLQTLALRKRADARWQLNQWDAGWYQLRMWLKKSTGSHLADARKRLEDIAALHNQIRDRLRPMLYELGCLPVEKIFE